MSALIGWLLMRQGMSRRAAVALVIGAAGAIWVIFRADIAALTAFRIGRGEAIFFWGCVAHAVYTPLARRLNRGESPVALTFGILAAGCVLLVGWGWRDIAATDWGGLRPLVWVTVLYTAIFAGSLTTLLIQYATLRLPSAKVMAYTYLTPSWVALWEIGLGHGSPGPLVLAGVALTVLALWLLLKDD
jgi:drug/metabolite transporter (DMT)-like permease